MSSDWPRMNPSMRIAVKAAHEAISKCSKRDARLACHAYGIRINEFDAKKAFKGYCIQICRIKTVVVDSSLSEGWKQTVIAHELGHLLLNPEGCKAGAPRPFILDGPAASGKLERSANLFAAEFLISDKSAVSSMTRRSLSDAACILGLPEGLLAYKADIMSAKGYMLFRTPPEGQSSFLL